MPAFPDISSDAASDRGHTCTLMSVALALCDVVCLLQILALMLLRQRGMRLTIISILEDLAVKLPPVRRNIELVRLQFAARFKHEDLMMQQITPPGFNAAEKVCLLTLT